MSSFERNGLYFTHPLSFAQYMEMCLYGADGYYQKQAKLGGKGADFYTSAQFPLFGRTLGKYVLDWWQQRGPSNVIQVAEFGPGQGELAEAVCTYLTEHASPDVTIRYVLVERADRMIRAQRMRLQTLARRIDFRWVEDASVGLDRDVPVIVLANEWLDALPVARVMKGQEGWLEAYVQQKSPASPLEFVWRPAADAVSKTASCVLPIQTGHKGEVCLLYDDVFHTIRKSSTAGHAVLIDYGVTYAELLNGIRPDGTLRAYHQHELVSVLEMPGDVDITADVNWDHVQNVMQQIGFIVHPLVSQAAFLMDAGILDVAQELLPSPSTLPYGTGIHTGEVARQIKTLVMPGGLGERFSVLTCDW